ncbi:MAG: Tim44 domain-containing protein [Betaproteobacteria bacterium]|nr:Tim44 domain-containing protein [Betaproteobacteria bacterium]
MKKFFAALLATVFCLGLDVADADAARRFGGGKSIGKQRESVTQQAAPRQPVEQPQAPAAAPAAPAGSRWLGPLAGLAAGGLLAALFMGGAFDGIKLMDVMVLMLLAAAVFFVVRMLRRPTPRPLQYSGLGASHQAPAPMELGVGGAAEVPRVPMNVPAEFKVDAFLRNARTSFIRLQAANDAGDLDDIREYTTPEMFAEISMQMRERDDEPQKTEVLSVNAELLEVVSEGSLAIASVRFTGATREQPGQAPLPFDEVWHVQKELKNPKSVWLIAGIQQVS